MICPICTEHVSPGREPWDQDEHGRDYHLACVEQLGLVRRLRRFVGQVENEAARPHLARAARKLNEGVTP